METAFYEDRMKELGFTLIDQDFVSDGETITHPTENNNFYWVSSLFGSFATISRYIELIESRRITDPYLPSESITFNPSDNEDIKRLLGTYGPEGLCEISRVLLAVAKEDMSATRYNEGGLYE